MSKRFHDLSAGRGRGLDAWWATKGVTAVWKVEHSVDTTARPDALWMLLADADGWPLWNPGLSSAHLDGPLQAGTTGRTTQSSGHKGHFTVVEFQAGAYFVNEAKVPGAVLRFQHRIETVDEARCRVTLGATIDGAMAPVWRLVIGRQIAGYLPTAVRQWAARAEAMGPATSVAGTSTA